jgi:hypothetical protein
MLEEDHQFHILWAQTGSLLRSTRLQCASIQVSLGR